MLMSTGTALVAVAAAVLLVACGDKGAAAAGPAGAGGMPPPPPVGVVTTALGSAGLSTELPGRLEAWRTAQVRARVTGIVQKRLFTEGADVKAGQSLFQLDAAPYRATLDSAQAALGKADANLAQAQATAQRNEPLAAAKAISQQEWIATQTAVKQAQADVASAKAAVQTARLNVDYASVLAPIGGRIGRSQVTEGALVGQGEATLLATIQQINPLYVNFTQSASEALRLRQAIERGALKRSGDASRVTVVLDDGSEYPLAGKLLFSDLTVDPTSGQVTLRAELPNPKGDLLPGLFVKVRLQQAQTESAILLPQQAVSRGSSGDTVLVVGADHQVSPRPVKVTAGLDNQWVVTDGLKPGEQVVVDGFQKIRPKTPVTPVPWSPAGAASGAAPAAAPSASAAASR
ncbi:membrane fusion protein (multidrug efflux system) [Sphaerotilus hippei]|uniref:Membrane fusion protein (Multidrug efflux system) n=1 Tax=Sphaerotilus hippei TaxID=744406 RepID=A0A318GXI8_9BURK|nr:efflux RND transporter periplasmic adaptor subunit [Sphaerotilus hippei]PXW94530.1 membrane fusion protein (multidrug efflux system) [Sphaerotilus hippei]